MTRAASNRARRGIPAHLSRARLLTTRGLVRIFVCTYCGSIVPATGAAQHERSHLAEWIRDERRTTSPELPPDSHRFPPSTTSGQRPGTV